MFWDIAVDPELKNVDPCTARGCLWPRATDGKVYVPFRISNQYSERERNTIIQGLASFARSTCIRFIPLDCQRDFVDIQYLSGCFSFVGRRGQGQVVSLSRQGCVFQSIIQHELLHALGFNPSRLFELFPKSSHHFKISGMLLEGWRRPLHHLAIADDVSGSDRRCRSPIL
ncbi:hatching enzyme 1.2-like [Gadus macrocephalus]|uniref:hatching enzyme 1.2-like n=1 Tax=Gadus macrocephalus TaxID=80720 RepID=UPI0028CB3FEE|nr:hatching enzyme 1.2-like [Gadus macrocephalus]